MKLSCKTFQQDLDGLQLFLEEMKLYIDGFEKDGEEHWIRAMERVKVSYKLHYSKLKEDISYTPESEAEEIIGEDNFVGTEIAEKIFGAKQDSKRIPFSRAELMEAKAKGMNLMYYPDLFRDGSEMNIKRIMKKAGDQQLRAPNGQLSHLKSIDLAGFLESYLAHESRLSAEDTRPMGEGGWSLVDVNTIEADEDVHKLSEQFNAAHNGWKGDYINLPNMFEVIYGTLTSKAVFEWMKKQENVLPRSRELVAALGDQFKEFFAFSIHTNDEGYMDFGIYGKYIKDGNIGLSHNSANIFLLI